MVGWPRVTEYFATRTKQNPPSANWRRRILSLVVVLRAAFGEPRKIFHKKILRGPESHRRSSGYEPDELLLLHPAMFLCLVANLSIVPYFSKNGKRRSLHRSSKMLLCLQVLLLRHLKMAEKEKLYIVNDI